MGVLRARSLAEIGIPASTLVVCVGTFSSGYFLSFLNEGLACVDHLFSDGSLLVLELAQLRMLFVSAVDTLER